MKKLISTITILFSLSQTCFCQFQIDWQQCYGGTEKDVAFNIVQIEGGGYMVIGHTKSNDGDISYFHGGTDDIWLTRIDNFGNLFWEKTYGGQGGDAASKIFSAYGSNNLFVVGWTNSTDGDITNNPYPGSGNIWAVKIDTLGSIIWDRVVGSTSGILSWDQYGIPTSDGGLVTTGQIHSQGGDVTNYFGGYDGWIIKLNSNGETEWDFTIGSSTDFEFINTIIQSSDGGYLAGLYGTPQGAGTGNVDCITQSSSIPDAILFKLDANGNEQWYKCYGGSGHDGITGLLETEDGYIISAFGGSNDGDLEGSGWHGDGDVWLIKVDFSGNIIWQKCYGGSSYESARNIFKTSDGGFVVFGTTFSFNGDVVGNHSNPGNPSIWVFKIDNSGELLWQQCIGSHADEMIHIGVIQKSDHNYVVAAEMNYSPSFDVDCSHHGNGNIDYWVFELTDTTVSIIETDLNKIGLKVYPNPANNYVIFEIPVKNSSNQNTEIIIKNIFGQTVEIISVKQKITTEKSKWVWDTNKIEAGVYFYTLKTSGFNKSGKIVISK